MGQYKVIPGWRQSLLKLVRQGHNVRAALNVLRVGQDKLVTEKRRDPEFASDLEQAINSGATKAGKTRSF